MADDAEKPEIDNEDVLELTDEVEQPGADAPEDEGDDEEIPTFGDTAEEERDTDNATVKHMRQVTRDALKRAAEAERRAAELEASAPKPKADDPGPEPTLEGCEWDEDRFKIEWRQWNKRVEAAEAEKTVATQSVEQQRQAWEQRLSKVAEEKAALGRPDADEAFDTVRSAIGDDKFGALVSIVDEGNAAKFIYALSRNPDQLTALAAQKDPIRLVKDVARLEGQLKMVKRRAAPEIDTPERGSGKVSTTPGGKQKQLAALKAKASESGDYTAYFAFKRDNGL